MGKVKTLQTDIQYIMNVLSANGEEKASLAFENVLTALGYKPAENVRDGAVLIPVPSENVRVQCTNGMVLNEPKSAEDVSLGKTIYRMSELRYLLEGLDDNDQICIEACDEYGDVEDLYPMSLDVIDGIRLTDGTTVREVRFCQRPNSEPDTRDKQPIVDALIDVLAEDMAKGDVTVLDELLLRMPFDVLKYALPEDMWADFETPEDSCKQSGQHLKSCDDDGFCNNCGNQ